MSFGYKNLSDVTADCEQYGCDINFCGDLRVLGSPAKIGLKTVPNRFCVHPMEGCDAAPDGSPSELTADRYMSFAAGGSGLIWFEAVAVVREGRASARQLIITEDNLAEFKKLADNIREKAFAENGYAPVLIMQLTHSGRFSKPDGTPHPIIAYHHDELDPRHNICPDLPVVTDEYLNALPQHFAQSALLAKRAGFDGVDVKCCHRYLLCELLSATDRGGKYGGSFENRTRLFIDCVDAVRKAVGADFIVGSRLNGFDAMPRGFSCDKADYMKPELSETLELVKILRAHGTDILNITTGSPYYNPFVNRPNDVDRQEPPLFGVSRMLSVVGEIQREVPDIPVVGTGFTYLREFVPFAAAGEISAGRCAFAGLGRMSFACPDFPRRVLRGELPPSNQLCTTCGKCAGLLRAGKPSYCVVRNKRAAE